MTEFDQSVCRNPDVASRCQWLETNGIGGFASSTITGLNTRRYHGLLVAATKPPVGRMVLLSKMEDARYSRPPFRPFVQSLPVPPRPVPGFLVRGGRAGTGEVGVHGLRGEHDRDPVRIARRSERRVHSRLRPLITFRDYHSTTHQNNSLNPSLAIELGRVTCSPYQGCPNLHFAHHAAEVRQTGNWYRNFEYSVEEQRGLDLQEDLFNPLVFDVRSEPRRARRKSGAAGYHWFADWGRDTMIAFARANPCDGAIRGCARHSTGLCSQCGSRNAAQPVSRCRRDTRIQTRWMRRSGSLRRSAHSRRTFRTTNSSAPNSTQCLPTSSHGMSVCWFRVKWRTGVPR